MYLSIIILPLLGSIVSGFFGRKVGVKGAQIITCLSVIITTILAILAFIEVGFNNIPVTINLFRWIDSEWFNIIWGFQYDSLTVAMLIPVLIISSLVHIYSVAYMNNDPRFKSLFFIIYVYLVIFLFFNLSYNLINYFFLYWGGGVSHTLTYWCIFFFIIILFRIFF